MEEPDALDHQEGEGWGWIPGNGWEERLGRPLMPVDGTGLGGG